MSGNLVAVSQGDRPGQGTRGRRLSAADKVERDRAVVIDRNRGLPWPVVAQRNGLGERQCRNIYRAWRSEDRNGPVGLDPQEWLIETLERLEAIQGAFALLAERADNSAAAVGALRGQMEAMMRQAELLVASGLLPRDLRGHFAARDAAGLVTEFIGVLERRNVSGDLVEELLHVIDERDRPVSGRGSQPVH